MKFKFDKQKKKLLLIAGIGLPLFAFILLRKKKMNPKNKTVLFVGDSHTTGCNWGYQSLLAKKYGFTEANIAEGGRTTGWCLQVLTTYLSNGYKIPFSMYRIKPCVTAGVGKKPDICFIFAGGNDAYNTTISMQTATNNIQKMVDLCNSKNITPIVIVGYDASKVQINNPKTMTTIYVKTKEGMWELGKRNYKFQLSLPTAIKNATVIPMWQGITMADAPDGIHMSQNAHKRFAEYIGSYIFDKQ